MTLDLGDSRKGGMKINELQEHRRSCLKRRQTCLRKNSSRKVQRQDLDFIERELQEQDTLVENLNAVLKGCKEKCQRINEKVNELIREVRKVKLQQEFYQINYLNLFERRPLRHRDVNASPYPEVLMPCPIFQKFLNSESITESLSNSIEVHRKKEKSQILLLQNRIPDGYVTMLPTRDEPALHPVAFKASRPKPQRSLEEKLAIDKNYRCLSCPSKFSK
ncbi:uncharacterized protein LOC112493958 [Cephus cinctus]|uniref:Uncharacterized protein LOC112493958 n=1 Tax=Cephus cinctus TaxID=211228 RepID=A0AAJ7RBY7_CEPCN|nr:uncharacterized protein LOC112493958 [Cephus cinctus]